MIITGRKPRIGKGLQIPQVDVGVYDCELTKAAGGGAHAATYRNLTVDGNAAACRAGGIHGFNYLEIP